jgi:hypothetical protein
MFKYIAGIIDKDNPSRCSAFLAIIAGITLCLGFNVLIWQKNKATELGLVTAGLVSLATFNKVDREPPKEEKTEELPK